MQEHDYLKVEIITTKKGGLSEEEKKYVFQVAVGPRLITILRTDLAKYKKALQEIRNYTSLTSIFTSTFGTPYKHGTIFFRKGFKRTFPIIDSFDFNGDTLPILIVDTGGEPAVRPPTEKEVQVQTLCPLADYIYNALSKIAIKGKEYIEDGKLELLGKLMSITHKLLTSLGGVNESINELARFLDRSGAYTRAIGYGREGAVIALYPDEEKDNFKSVIKRPARIILDEVSLKVPGVMLE